MRPLRVLAAALVVVTGCGGAEDPATTSTVPPTVPSAVPTTAAATTVGPEAGAASDVDGDGIADTVTVEDADEGPLLVVHLGSGPSASLPLEPSPVPPEVAAVVSLDGGRVIVVHVGRGASTDLYGLYTWDGELAPVTLPAGGAAVFAVGASATHVSGLACDGGLTVLSAESSDGEVFATAEIGYRLDGTGLAETGRRTGTARLGDPVLAPELAC